LNSSTIGRNGFGLLRVKIERSRSADLLNNFIEGVLCCYLFVGAKERDEATLCLFIFVHRAYVMRVDQDINPLLFLLEQLVNLITVLQGFDNDESGEHTTSVTTGRLHQLIESLPEGSSHTPGMC